MARSFSFMGLLATVGYLIWTTATTLRFYNEFANSIIIGGADGPTSIFVLSSSVNITSIIIVVAILFVSIGGMCLTRRK